MKTHTINALTIILLDKEPGVKTKNSLHIPNLMKIYQVVQKISIHPLYLKPASNTFRSFLPHSKLHALVTIVTLAKDYTLCNHGNPKTAPTGN
jgi:hypothetical protein